MECSKVQVPVHAISRVIERAGSNINAIRAATGAHIEVEKQGKVQVDRSIKIKGRYQASPLIVTLIKDPVVDILTMLPKHSANTASSKNSSSVAQSAAPVQQMTSLSGVGTTARMLSSVVDSGSLAASILIPNSTSVTASSAAKVASKKMFVSLNLASGKPVTASARLSHRARPLKIICSPVRHPVLSSPGR